MEDLFRSYWWLIFPLGWFVASGVFEPATTTDRHEGYD